MKVLYKDENGCYAAMEVSKVSYVPEVGVLEFCGPEEDFAVEIGAKEAEKIVRKLYEEGKADVSEYPYCEIEIEEDDDDDDDDFLDDDDDDEDFIGRIVFKD